MEQHVAKMWNIGTYGSKFVFFNPVVTILSGVCIWGFVISAMVLQTEAKDAMLDGKAWVTDVWNWLYMLSQNIWIVILMYVGFKYYDLKLGPEDSEPEFNDVTYFAMIFACGMATGLWFFTAEAMWHYEGYDNPRWMDEQMMNQNTRAEHSLVVTFFHWGIHGWIAFVVIAAQIAMMSYRRGFPMCVRFTLYPIFGEMVYGLLGDCVEVLSILCTVFGVCTSLGLGAMQINKGLVRLDRGTHRGQDYFGCEPGQITCKGNTGMEVGTGSQIVIVVCLTSLATISVVLGLKRGLKVLSQAAFFSGTWILLCILFMDETWYILNALTSAIGYYMWYLPKLSFHTDAWEELGSAAMGLGGAPDDRGGAKGWMNGWTIFYLGWWISWGPFCGTFLARIAKGRRLGPFIMTSLILGTLTGLLYVGIIGAAQIRISNQAIAAGLDQSDPAHIYGHLADKSQIGYNQTLEGGATVWVPVYDGTVRLYALATENVLFEHLCYYGGRGWATFMTIVTLVCIILYFITSSDSASYVVDMLAANGTPEPPMTQRVFWAMSEGAAACALLASASDDTPDAALKAVQALPIILGLPFTFIFFWMCQGLLIVCKEEAGELKLDRKNFSIFILNFEPMSGVSFLAPFVPLGAIASKIWGGTAVKWAFGYGAVWLSMIVLIFLALADKAFASMAAGMYFMFGFAVAGLRMNARMKVGIDGDIISDVSAGLFAMPWAVGQMFAEDLDGCGEKGVSTEVSSVKDI